MDTKMTDLSQNMTELILTEQSSAASRNRAGPSKDGVTLEEKIVGSLYEQTENSLVKQMLALPPGLLEKITKKCILELEESIYEQMYDELNNYLPGDVEEVYTNAKEGNYTHPKDLYVTKARPYNAELAKNIVEYLNESNKSFLRRPKYSRF